MPISKNAAARAERMLAQMYSKLSTAHRFLAISYEEPEREAELEALAESYFDTAEELGRNALNADAVHCVRWSSQTVLEMLDAAMVTVCQQHTTGEYLLYETIVAGLTTCIYKEMQERLERKELRSNA